MSDGIVIAGGGLAAQRCAAALRRHGHEGCVRMICAEELPPYNRPPLSKEALAEGRSHDELALRPRDWYAERDVDLLLGERATGLSPATRRVHLASGSSLRYERLLVATGAQARSLPGVGGRENAHVLRDHADAARLRAALRPGVRLVIVGAGFIGLEVAATARALGAEVAVVEAAAAPLVPVLGRELGSWFADLHRAEGVDVRLGAPVAGFEGPAGRVDAVVLTGGERLACDVVLVAVGTRAATGWLGGAGLPADGIPVDAAGRTAAPYVFAAGDAARPLDPALGVHVRSEHWEAAGRQGAAAAAGMLGRQPSSAPAPSFWSDQYGIRIHHVGHRAGAGSVEIDGTLDKRDFAATWMSRGRPVAGLLVGRPAGLPDLRRRVARAASPHPERAAA